MKLLFVWTGLTSYMADCWRRLAAEPGVELEVWIDAGGSVAKAVDFESQSLMRGITWRSADDWAADGECLRREIGAIAERGVDVAFVVGWHSPLCRAVVLSPQLAAVPKVCCFDMPWRWCLRCLAAPLVLGAFLRHYRAAFVPGSVCARYARWLGFRKVHEGLFSIDTTKFARVEGGALAAVTGFRASQCSGGALAAVTGFRASQCSGGALAAGYFLYIGRNSEEKRLDDLRAAHHLYRERGGKLELRLYGKGLEGGFVAPESVPALMHGAAAFVLASAFDPWPLVLLEAMSAGCPVIASDRCTNRPELGANWKVFKCGDVEGLARAMLDVENGGDHAVSDVVANYDCRAWVARVRRIAGELMK